MVASRVEVAVLGLLAEEPMHGYELCEQLRERGMDLWAGIARASVYQALARLESSRLIGGRSREGREGPDRRVFRISAAGRTALEQAVIEHAGGDAEASRLALAFVHHLGAREARTAIAARERALREHAAALADAGSRAARSGGPGAAVAIQILEGQAAITEADLAWMSAFRRSRGRGRR